MTFNQMQISILNTHILLLGETIQFQARHLQIYLMLLLQIHHILQVYHRLETETVTVTVTACFHHGFHHIHHMNM